MIVVDSSALMAVALNEPQAGAVVAILDAEPDLVVSAATIAEALIVAQGRGLGADMEKLIGRFDFKVRSVGLADAHRVAAAYARWGKGFNPARLNFGDCFAYALAKELDCPLLFLGNDFARTDVRSALAERARPGSL